VKIVRNFYFLIFILILALAGVGLTYLSQQIFHSYEAAFNSKIQANLLVLQLEETRFLKEQSKEITLLFVGDIMLARGIAKQIKKYQDPRYPFLKIASTTQSVNLTFGNLEGPISSRGKNQGSIYSFRAKPEVIEGLKFAGFDILSLANNHILDWGKQALEDTITTLNNNSIKTIGAGRNYQEANKPVIIDFNIVKIAFLAYTNLYPNSFKAINDSAGISDFDINQIKKEIWRIKNSSSHSEQAADIVIISFHWGDEYQIHSNKIQQNIAHALIDAGADLIIGHHPHSVQEIESYRNGWIAYSLGNFIFDQNFSKETQQGLILKVKIQNKKIVEVKPIKIKFSKTFQLELDSSEIDDL